MVNDLEWQRKQLADLQSMLTAQGKHGPAIASIKTADDKITALEAKMYQIEQTSARKELRLRCGSMRRSPDCLEM
jgi:hypothetical protein